MPSKSRTPKSIKNEATNETTGNGGELHQLAGGSHPPLTTQTGAIITDDENSLRAGERGPTLLDADRHVLTFGAGLTWSGRLTTLQLDGFVQWHHLQPNARVSGDFAAFGFSIGVDL